MNPDEKRRYLEYLMSQKETVQEGVPAPDFGEMEAPKPKDPAPTPNGATKITKDNLTIDKLNQCGAVFINLGLYGIVATLVYFGMDVLGKEFRIFSEFYVKYPLSLGITMIIMVMTWQYIHVVGQPQKLLIYKDNLSGKLYRFKPGLSIIPPWVTPYTDMKEIELKVETTEDKEFVVVEKRGVELKSKISFSIEPAPDYIQNYIKFGGMKAISGIIERELKSRASGMFGRNGWDTISVYQGQFFDRISQIFADEKTLSPLEQYLGVNVTQVRCTLITPSDAAKKSAELVIRTRLFVLTMSALRKEAEKASEGGKVVIDMNKITETALKLSQLEGVKFQQIQASDGVRTVVLDDDRDRGGN